MPILATTQIHINGNKLPYFNSCSLHQEIGNHHIMKLHCLLETIQKFCKDNDQEIEDLLGTIITIETKSFANVDFYGKLKFKGIITGLNYRKGLHSSSGDVVLINAKSPSIITDDGSHYKSYNEMSFVDIIKDNFTNYDTSKLKINTNNSKLTQPLTYTVQYNESCFKFAQRMAARNGEWIYYNGEELVFGLDPETEELELILGRDLQDFNTSLNPIPQNYNYYTNDYLTNNIHETPSSSAQSISEGTFGSLNDRAREIYANPTRVWVNLSDDSNSRSRLDDYVNLQQTALQTNQVTVSGTSDNPGVMLATPIKISQSTYRVTKVTHTFSSNGEYENFFGATSTAISTYPNTNVNAYPQAQSQMAKVIENHDPQGLGRVKVQFPWQKPDGLSTPWIRNVSPSASSGQGFYFVPEVDDEVLVDFEGGNAECPYVIGGVYNANATPPAGSSNSNNHIKMLQSRSGSVISLNDETGSIYLSDKAGSYILLDGSGNVSIHAEKDIVISGKNLYPTLEEKIVAGAPEIFIKGDNKLDLSSDSELLTRSNNTTIGSSLDTKINGLNIEVNATANAKINGTAGTEIKGAQVKIN